MQRGGYLGGALSPGRYSLTLDPVQPRVEAIGGTTDIVGRGYSVAKIGASERILPHSLVSGALVAPTEGSTKTGVGDRHLRGSGPR